MLRLLLVSAVVPMLAACGGGGTWSTCAKEPTFSVDIQWNTNGQIGNEVNGKLNVPLTATPIITGLPASCLGQESFSMSIPPPAGLTFNSRTGVLSGTPTFVISYAKAGIVSLRLPGYSEVSILSKITIAP